MFLKAFFKTNFKTYFRKLIYQALLKYLSGECYKTPLLLSKQWFKQNNFGGKSALSGIIAFWWWFCPCRVGGSVWNHTAWLFPLMSLPTKSLFYSYFLSRNKYRKNITWKNIGQFQFCINLLPLALIWRSAPCLKHWNQRRFKGAAFTIPSGKQWDHMSPWSPSWLSAGIDECCRSANESGHQWLKNSWLETIWH